MLYPLLYLAAIATLALWFSYRNSEQREPQLQRLFFVFFALYVGTVLLSGISLGDKLWVLFRDLGFMAVLGLLFQFAVQKSAWLMGAVALSVGMLSWFVPAQMSGSLKAPSAELLSYDPDAELLIELAEGSSDDVLQNIAYKYKLTFAPAFHPESPELTELDDYLSVDVPASALTQIEDIIKDLQSIPEVDWVEPNEIITLGPWDGEAGPRANRNFGVDDPGIAQLWGFEAMEVDQLYRFLRQQSPPPAKRALIVILDTGVDAKHEDLAGNYRSLNSADDNDPRGHGTHCAGIAAAVSDNGLGIASFSLVHDYVEVSSIKVLNAAGMGTQKSIISGMIKAVDAGADVLSLSLGGLSNQTKERAYRKAVEYAQKKGAIVVAAAGNSNRNAKGFVPASVEGVIAVSAVDSELQRAVFSNDVGELEMGLAAPGVGIYSTIPGNQYDTYNGTSMAAPYVSGLIGLLKSLQPDLTAKQAYELLNRTGKATRQTEATGRFIQPAAAVEALLLTQ